MDASIDPDPGPLVHVHFDDTTARVHLDDPATRNALSPRLSLELADAPIPTIAVVDGAVVGAGVNLPLACDVVLVSPDARFDPRFLDVGIHPGGGHLQLLRERVGRQGAAAWSLCGDQLTGEDAVTAGLAWRCLPSDELLGTAPSAAQPGSARAGPDRL
jgi:enoyl-CoA hydratase